MASPENGEEIGIRADLRVKLDANNLNVVGDTGAHKFVIGARNVALRVAHLRLQDTDHSLKRQLYSPEAPCSKLRELMTRSMRLVEIWIQSRVAVIANPGICHFSII